MSREAPGNFAEALAFAEGVLSLNPEIVRRQTVKTEAEQLVLATFCQSEGRALTRMDLYSRIQDRFPEKAGERLMILAHARAGGKLLQHLTGVQFFFEHDYEVGPDVLVPRPETEVLLQTAIQHLNVPKKGIEIGLGSGNLSIELLVRFSSLEMDASELSSAAIERARKNADQILGPQAARLQILQAARPLEVFEVFAELPLGGCDFLISNPPYLLDSEAEVEAEVREQEPAGALFAPAGDPLFFYRKIAEHAGRFLSPGGKVFLEIPHSRARAVSELFALHRFEGIKGVWKRSTMIQDLTGRDRVLMVERS